MKKIILTLLLSLCSFAQATGLVDLKFGQAQIADSQWNVSACMYTTTCQIYSKNPGTAYKIPWTSGQIQWAAGDYIQFQPYTKDPNNPWLAVQYGANGVGKTNMGLGHIINMGNDFFFFVGSDNNTGQLFSMTSGLSGSAGVTWTGTLNPTVAQVDAYATNGSTTPLAAGQTATPAGPPPPPPLCCGGNSTAFNADANKTAHVMTFATRTTQDNQVYIIQIGNQNTITVDQSGTKNNYFSYYGNGSNNTITSSQTGTPATQANFIDLTVVGNSNTVNLSQQSTGGAKGAFVNIQDNNNSLTLQQKDSGSHYAEVSLSGGNKNVDILQQGSASQMAKVTLTGLPVDLSLSQSGSTQNFYSINFNCATAGGCAKISVQQGQ
jgi:hypothetical protein